jgi:hypothetical protein
MEGNTMKLAIPFVCLVLASVAVGALAPRTPSPALPAALVGSTCLQDQYGNQYSFTVDAEHGYVFGTMTDGQGCGTISWPLTGSFAETAEGLLLELTVANPDGGAFCVPTFKLKGLFPRFAWYYATGYGAQESTYAPCGSDATADPSSGGLLGLPH